MPQYFNWRSGFNRNLILSRIDGVRKIDSQRCSFSPAQDLHFWLPVLNSAILAHSNVGLLKASCVMHSLSDASLRLNDPDAFLVRCDQAFANLSKRPKSKFIFYTTVTYSGPKVIDWISDGPFRIYWQPADKGPFVSAALRAREDLSFKRRAHKIPDDSDQLTTLVHVNAFDASDAFEKANDCVDRFRGMLNLMINSTNSVHPFGDLAPPHAINRFRRGPFHTLHKPDGSLATETFWYEPRWEHNHPAVIFEGGPAGFKKKFADWWRRLHNNPMSGFTSEALLRYCRALRPA